MIFLVLDKETTANEMSITIKKFDPSKMDDRRTCMIIGKRNTGKSVLTKDIMFHKRHLPAGMVMSGTEDGNGWYSKWVPASFVYNEFNAAAVSKLIECQRAKSRLPVPQKAFLVLDDCMFDKKVMREKCIRQLFMNGRHWGIFLISTCQYVADAGPEIRSNCDYVFVMKENIMSNRERLYRMYFGIFPTFQAFNAAMDACTEDYGCLVLDNTCQSNDLDKNVFWYKAKIRDFRMGAPQLWHYHSKHYRSEGSEPAQSLLTGMASKRGDRTGGIHVRKVVKRTAKRPAKEPTGQKELGAREDAPTVPGAPGVSDRAKRPHARPHARPHQRP